MLGSFAVLWVALLLLRLYFTMNLSLRSPTRILGQLAPIGIMLYLVQELRYRVGAKRAALFRVMAAVALIAGLACSGLPLFDPGRGAAHDP